MDAFIVPVIVVAVVAGIAWSQRKKIKALLKKDDAAE